MKALRFVLACVLLCSVAPVAAQETMEAATLRQHMIMATGKPPDSYVVTTRVAASNAVEYTIREFHRGLNYSEIVGEGPHSTSNGRFEGREWDRNPNGLTTIHVPDSGLARPDARKVSILRVSQPLDAWKYEELNARGTGTVEYVDANTYRLVREDEITQNGTIETDYEDFRTVNGYTIAFRIRTNDQVSQVQSRASVVSFVAQPVADAELAIPPSRSFVTFPDGQTRVELPAVFIDRKNLQIRYGGGLPRTQDRGTVAVIIRAEIGGRGVDFQLDTGHPGIILDQNVVHELGLREYAQHSEVMAGRYSAASVVVPSLRIGSIEMRDLVVESVPYTYDLETDLKIAGLLGYDFIRSIGLTVDYAHKKVIAMPADVVTAPIMTPESDILPLRIVGNWPMVTANINGSVADRMIVDTGYDGDMVLFDYFSRRYPEAIDPRVATRLNNGVRLYGVGGSFATTGYELADVDIGKYHFRRFHVLQVAPLKSYDYPADGMIGTDILKHFAVTFDFAGGKMYLVHNEGQ